MNTAQNLNDDGPVPFSGHVHRVIDFLDELYEFGPTEYYAMITSGENAIDQFGFYLYGLNTDKINIGISRIRELKSRNRVTPKAEDFKVACAATDQQWIWLSQTNKFQCEREDVL